MTPSPTSEAIEIDGLVGQVHGHHWPAPNASYVVLLAHGFGEHAGRYEHVAQALVASGATVYAPDHYGHGLSEGARALVLDIEDMVSDLHQVAGLAAAANPGLPTVLIGHSMGGVIATRYAQRYGDTISALALSGPFIGGNPGFEPLLAMDEIPDIPIDPAILSNDPAVGEAYAADDLVYHGPLQRESLQALVVDSPAKIAGGGQLTMPTVWLHGTADALAPVDVSEAALDAIAPAVLEKHRYDGAQHEVLNEVNRDDVIATIIAFLKAQLA
jgi:alpha-beta hydrolase superfamily lysophospholipase